jgi:hypothetical protein
MRSNLTKKLQSVVKVLTVSDSPDYEQPWQSHGPSNSTGSGGIVLTKRGLRVLTNGHVVQNQVFVELRRFGASRKYVAEVEGVSHECDLALLRVPREEFFQGAEPIEIGDAAAARRHGHGLRLPDRRRSAVADAGGRVAHRGLGVLPQPASAVERADRRRGERGQQRRAGVQGRQADRGRLPGARRVTEHRLRDQRPGHRALPRGTSTPAAPRRSRASAWCGSVSSPTRTGARSGSSAPTAGVLVARVAYESTAWGVIQEGDVILAIDGRARRLRWHGPAAHRRARRP